MPVRKRKRSAAPTVTSPLANMLVRNVGVSERVALAIAQQFASMAAFVDALQKRAPKDRLSFLQGIAIPDKERSFVSKSAAKSIVGALFGESLLS